MSCVRNILTDPRPGDAKKLAQFWADSQAAWPGGGQGQYSEAEAAKFIRERDMLGVLMAEADGRFVALCEVDAKKNQKMSAYVYELVALTEYQGKGYGKAALLSAIERAHDLGYDRIDLDTWDGNELAIPLYKKCGFMWIPDTSVDMFNFTLTARRHPATREYFAEHDWYATQVRDLAVCEDLFKHGKVRAFPYEWRAKNGDSIRMVFDRLSKQPILVENSKYRVACYLEDEDLIAGLPHRIRWEITNHGATPLEVQLETKADKGVKIRFKRIVRVVTSKVITTTFEINPEAPPKKKDPWAHIINTKCVINGTTFTLGAGFNLKQPVEVFLDPQWPVLKPNQTQDVNVYVRSMVDTACHVTPKLTVNSGSSIAWSDKKVPLRAREVKRLDLTLKCKDTAPLMLKGPTSVKIAGRRAVNTKSAELPLLVRDADECVGGISRHAAVLAGPAVKVRINRRNASLTFHDVVRHRVAGHVTGPKIGPPFEIDTRFETEAKARIRKTKCGLCAALSAGHPTLKGIHIERRVYLDNTSLIRVEDAIINDSGKSVEFEVSRSVRGYGERCCVPTADGVVEWAWGDGQHSFYELKLPKESEHWPESWTAAEHKDGGVTGMFWQDATWVKHYGNALSCRCPLPKLKPGDRATAAAIHCYAGPGDPTAMRRIWQTLRDDPAPIREVPRLATEDLLKMDVCPSPLFVQDEAKAKVVIKHPGEFKLKGTWELKLPKVVKGSPRKGEFKGIAKARQLNQQVLISSKCKRARVETGRLLIKEQQRKVDRPFNLVIGASDRPVLVGPAGDDILRVDNRILSIDVCPTFGGSVTDIQFDGVSQVWSSYPEARPLRWWNPWHGGLQPEHQSLRGNALAGETFLGKSVRRRGSQGVVWQGVRLQLTPKHKRARGQRMAVEYLLTDGLPILAVILERRQLLDCPVGFGVAVDGFFRPGGKAGKLAATTAQDPSVQVFSGEEDIDVSGRDWSLVENQRTGHSLILVRNCGKGGMSMTLSKELGCQACLHFGGRLEPKETQRALFFFVFGKSAAEARQYSCLAELRELP